MGITMFQLITRKILSLVDRFLAESFHTCCILCKKTVHKNIICDSCLNLPLIFAPWCKKCGITISAPLLFCGECMEREKKQNSFVEQIRSLYWLCSRGKEIVHWIKFQRRLSLLLTLCHYRNEFYENLKDFPKDGVLIPVPLSKEKFLERGFNQSEVLARFLSIKTERDFAPHVLFRRKSTPQSHLSKKMRFRNVKNIFGVSKNILLPKKVILIDDIFTTGQTIEEIARMIKKQGVKEVYAWTLFRTPKLKENERREVSQSSDRDDYTTPSPLFP